LQAYLATGTSQVRNLIEKLLRKLFCSTDLFFGCESEVHLWLNRLTVQAIPFLDSVLCNAAKRPYQYADKLAEVCSQRSYFLWSVDSNDERSNISTKQGFPFSVLLLAALSSCYRQSFKGEKPLEPEHTQYLASVLFSELQSQANPLTLAMAVKACFRPLGANSEQTEETSSFGTGNSIEISVPADENLVRFVQYLTSLLQGVTYYRSSTEGTTTLVDWKCKSLVASFSISTDRDKEKEKKVQEILQSLQPYKPGVTSSNLWSSVRLLSPQSLAELLPSLSKYCRAVRSWLPLLRLLFINPEARVLDLFVSEKGKDEGLATLADTLPISVLILHARDSPHGSYSVLLNKRVNEIVRRALQKCPGEKLVGPCKNLLFAITSAILQLSMNKKIGKEMTERLEAIQELFEFIRLLFEKAQQGSSKAIYYKLQQIVSTHPLLSSLFLFEGSDETEVKNVISKSITEGIARLLRNVFSSSSSSSFSDNWRYHLRKIATKFAEEVAPLFSKDAPLSVNQALGVALLSDLSPYYPHGEVIPAIDALLQLSNSLIERTPTLFDLLRGLMRVYSAGTSESEKESSFLDTGVVLKKSWLAKISSLLSSHSSSINSNLEQLYLDLLRRYKRKREGNSSSPSSLLELSLFKHPLFVSSNAETAETEEGKETINVQNIVRLIGKDLFFSFLQSPSTLSKARLEIISLLLESSQLHRNFFSDYINASSYPSPSSSTTTLNVLLPSFFTYLSVQVNSGEERHLNSIEILRRQLQTLLVETCTSDFFSELPSYSMLFTGQDKEKAELAFSTLKVFISFTSGEEGKKRQRELISDILEKEKSIESGLWTDLQTKLAAHCLSLLANEDPTEWHTRNASTKEEEEEKESESDNEEDEEENEEKIEEMKEEGEEEAVQVQQTAEEEERKAIYSQFVRSSFMRSVDSSSYVLDRYRDLRSSKKEQEEAEEVDEDESETVEVDIDTVRHCSLQAVLDLWIPVLGLPSLLFSALLFSCSSLITSLALLL
jgi:hypothetical protein